jgi:uncharacterized protein YeaO (DUF488 family)
MAVLLKHALEAASPEDGARVLVDRRQPTGVGGKTLELELRTWLPVLGPSDTLGSWFGERPTQWPLFRRRYLAELCDQKASDALSELHVMAAREQTLTLLTTAEDRERSHAAILRDLLEGIRKPPATTGPTRAAGGAQVRAARRNR